MNFLYIPMSQAMVWCDFVNHHKESGLFAFDSDLAFIVFEIEQDLRANGGEQFGDDWKYFFWDEGNEICVRFSVYQIRRMYSLTAIGIRFYHSRLDGDREDWRLVHLVHLEEILRQRLGDVEVDEAKSESA